MNMPLDKEVGLGPGHIVLDGSPVVTQPPQQPLRAFGPYLMWPNGHPSQQLLSSCFGSLLKSSVGPAAIDDIFLSIANTALVTALFPYAYGIVCLVILCLLKPLTPSTTAQHSAVAEMGVRLAKINMGRKAGEASVLLCMGELGPHQQAQDGNYGILYVELRCKSHDSCTTSLDSSCNSLVGCYVRHGGVLRCIRLVRYGVWVTLRRG